MKVTAKNLDTSDLLNNNSNKNIKVIASVAGIIGAIVLFIIGAVIVFGMNRTTSSNNNTTSTIASTSNTSTSIPSTSSSVVSSSTVTGSITVSPSVSTSISPSISGTASVTPTISTTQSSTPVPAIGGRDKEYDFAISYPGDWTQSTSVINKDCTSSQSYLKTACTGSLTAEKLIINSPVKDSAGNNYYLTLEGASSAGTTTCDSGSTTTTYYAVIKNNHYDIPTCINATGEQTATINLNIPGNNSKWNAVTMKFNMKDRTMMDQFLDVLVSIH